MAALWKVPVIFIIENNHFGMGTAEKRASKSAQFYTRGDYIPGLWVDGMDVLAVKNGVAFAREFVLQHGPIVLEMVCGQNCTLTVRHACLQGLAVQSCEALSINNSSPLQMIGSRSADLAAGYEHALLLPVQGPEACC